MGVRASLHIDDFVIYVAATDMTIFHTLLQTTKEPYSDFLLFPRVDIELSWKIFNSNYFVINQSRQRPFSNGINLIVFR